MKTTTRSLLLLFLMTSTLMTNTATAQQPDLVSLMSKDLTDFPGKEVLPGGGDPVHRHDAHGFIYVLEGSVVMQVRGGKEVTLGRGRRSTRGPTMFTSSAGTPAARSQRNSW